ncbi:reverse transcriptase domain-containing protein [Tanacetum coccineum]|uniref:Reverse transcriptase domain-containing protein n=1 Tax=Tanacetum coccineum TaxID=301880 RepID=A0ABQ4ZII7_9ASTR
MIGRRRKEMVVAHMKAKIMSEIRRVVVVVMTEIMVVEWWMSVKIWCESSARETTKVTCILVLALLSQIGRNIEAYMDDTVIKSMDEEDMLADIQETFERLQKINMILNPKKCSFGMEEGKFLGYVVSKQGIDTSVNKPQTTKDHQGDAKPKRQTSSPQQVSIQERR